MTFFCMSFTAAFSLLLLESIFSSALDISVACAIVIVMASSTWRLIFDRIDCALFDTFSLTTSSKHFRLLNGILRMIHFSRHVYLTSLSSLLPISSTPSRPLSATLVSTTLLFKVVKVSRRCLPWLFELTTGSRQVTSCLTCRLTLTDPVSSQ